MSATEAIADMVRAMELEGMKPIEPIANRLSSGELIRFRCEGDGKGRLNGWAKLYLDERPAGAFGNYRLGIDRKWKLAAEYQPLSREEREAMQREWAEAKQKRLEERQRCEAAAAQDAEEMWSGAQSASAIHPYVAKKRLDPSLLRQAGDNLLIPMLDAAGKLWNLQRIAPDGSKRFLYGGRVDGLFCIIGHFTRRGETACIGEGYSTMAAVHRATGFPSIVTFSNKNMMAVARLWNAARPDLDYIICADDDPHLIDHPQIRKNLGVVTAQAVAEEIGARVALPRPPAMEAA